MNDVTILKNINIAKTSNDFISCLDVSEKTIETYGTALRQFVKWTAQNNISMPVREDIIADRESLKERLKPTAIQTYLIALRQFFKWMAFREIYPNVMENVKGIKNKRST